MTTTTPSFNVARTDIEDGVRQYFGLTKGGVDLLDSLAKLPIRQLDNLVDAMRRAQSSGGRVFFMGNGGSHDNARALALWCRRAGLDSKTPGREDDYPEVTRDNGYDQIFVKGLEADRLNPNDVVVGISGSGNSGNVVNALSYANQVGASAFCLGGRDGGKMAKICGEEKSIVVPNQCMEAIEDLHLFAGIVALRTLAAGQNASVSEQLGAVVSAATLVVSERNLPLFADIAQGVLETVENGSRVLVLGKSIGANHVCADWERGATNRLPIRGVSAPMMYSLNADMATLNDDGAFSLAHGLVKKTPRNEDFAIVFDVLTPESEIRAAVETLDDFQVRYARVGGKGGLNLDAFSGHEQDLVPAMVGHFVSATLREILGKRFQVEKFTVPGGVSLPPGDKKLSKAKTLELEARMRGQGLLPDNRVLVFNYGDVFSANDPKQFGLRREFY